MANLNKLKKALAKGTKDTTSKVSLKDKLNKNKATKPAKAKATKPAKEVRKRAVGFTVPEKTQSVITDTFEKMQNAFDDFSANVTEFIEGKKALAKDSRQNLMDIIKVAKELRNIIQESKDSFEPIYKD